MGGQLVSRNAFRSGVLMSRDLRSAVALLALTLGACGAEEPTLPDQAPSHAGAKITPADLAGCYDLALGAWNPPVDASRAHLHSPPTRVQLTIELLPLPRTQLPNTPASYRMVDRDGRSPFTVQAWSVVGPSRAALTWSTGQFGITARVDVNRRSRELNGSASTINGASGGSSASIRLSRTPC